MNIGGGKNTRPDLSDEIVDQEGVVSLIENRALTSDEIGLLASLIIDEPDHYTVLGVNRDASIEEIQNGYCLAVEYFHPLKCRTMTESDSVMHWRLSSAFIRIEEAFRVLSLRSRRKIYDDALSGRMVSHQKRKSRERQSVQAGQWPAGGRPWGAAYDRTKEQRRVERVPLKLPLRVTFDRQWQEVTETLDVSPLGMKFRLSRPMEPGSELRLELPMPRHLRTHSYDDPVYTVRAFVIYTADDDSGRRVAAEFI